MADYISREAAVKLLTSIALEVPKSKSRTVAKCINKIELMPAADVEPVRHGRWEGYCHSRFCGTDEFGDPIYRDGVVYYCSNPKCRRKTVVKENFCPSCGAKMDLEGENNEK